MSRIRTSVLLLVFYPLLGSAGSDQDSLYRAWKDDLNADSARLEALRTLIWDHQLFVKPDSAYALSQVLYHQAEALGARKYMALALNMQAIASYQRGELTNALDLCQRGMEVQQARGDSNGVSSFLHVLGVIRRDQGDLRQAMELFTRELRIQEALGAKDKAGPILNAIGAVHMSLTDNDQAFDYYERCLVLSKELGDSAMIATALGNMGSVELNRDKPTEALAYLQQALGINEAMGAQRAMAFNLRSMTKAYMAMKQWDEALRYAEHARRIRETLGDPRGLSKCYVDIAEIQYAKGMLPQAESFAQQALALARQADEVEGIMNAASVLYQVYKALGRSGDALAMHELFVQMNDSLTSAENERGVMQQRFQYEYEKKELLAQAEQDKKDALATEELRRKNLQRNVFFGGFALMVLLTAVFLTQRNRISKEKKRSEALLLNILPEEVAEELKAKGEAEAKQIDSVTVLFTDFKGFTAMSEQLSPKELIRDIHECFSAFDHIMAKHGIEKIKTMGDAYMAAGGLPTPNTTHALDVVKAALEIRDFIAEGKARRVAAGLPYFEIRIGIHTGPVLAGIVGVKKFAYDIWGDTVNTASRMESSGEVGKVNISEATYRLVVSSQLSAVSEDGPDGQLTTNNRQLFTFTARGKVQAKGKGEMEMYFVERSA